MKKGLLDHDYDGFWKGAFDGFLFDALALLAPDVLAEIDVSGPIDSLDKELHALVPETRGGSRFVDKLYKLRRRNGRDIVFLLHVEIQSERDPDLERRMFCYRYRLFEKHAYDVATLVVLADDDETWRPSCFERRFLTDELIFRFRSIKLLDLVPEIEQRSRLDNPFSVLLMAYLRTRRSKPDRRRSPAC